MYVKQIHILTFRLTYTCTYNIDTPSTPVLDVFSKSGVTSNMEPGGEEGRGKRCRGWMRMQLDENAWQWLILASKKGKCLI